MTEPRIQHVEMVGLQARQSLEVQVVRACAKCQAPARYMSDSSIMHGWPGCYVPRGDPRDGSFVGDHCPNCGAPRGPELVETMGEVWAKEMWAPPAWPRWIRYIVNLGRCLWWFDPTNRRRYPWSRSRTAS